MKKLILILFLASCKKDKISPVYSKSFSKVYEGTWWDISGSIKDSLVVKFDKVINDSVYYYSNVSYLDCCLKHKIDYEMKEENLILNKDGKVFEFRHE